MKRSPDALFGLVHFVESTTSIWWFKPEIRSDDSSYGCFFVEVVDTSKFPVSHRSSINEERFEFDLLRAFQSEWFEVAIWAHKIGEDLPEFLAPDQIIESFPTSSPNRKRNRTKSAKRRSGHLHSDTGLYSQLPWIAIKLMESMNFGGCCHMSYGFVEPQSNSVLSSWLLRECAVTSVVRKCDRYSIALYSCLITSARLFAPAAAT